MLLVLVVQLSDEAGGASAQSSAEWLMSGGDWMLSSFCESDDTALAMMPQHNDKQLVTNHLRLRHGDVVEFRVSSILTGNITNMIHAYCEPASMDNSTSIHFLQRVKSFLPRDAMGLCLCLSASVSVTSRSSTKTAKRRITQTTPHDTPGTLVF